MAENGAMRWQESVQSQVIFSFFAFPPHTPLLPVWRCLVGHFAKLSQNTDDRTLVNPSAAIAPRPRRSSSVLRVGNGCDSVSATAR